MHMVEAGVAEPVTTVQAALVARLVLALRAHVELDVVVLSSPILVVEALVAGIAVQRVAEEALCRGHQVGAVATQRFHFQVR